nr:MAG TPA: hypothetical protein [Caudoviricetes sp.]
MIQENKNTLCHFRQRVFQTVDKALREIMFLGAFFYHYKDVWG